MKRIVIICACEQQYQGLHGMNDVQVLELEENELEIANECGRELSEQVISSYGYLLDGHSDNEDTTEENDDWWEDGDGTEWYIYRQKDDSNLTLEEVEEMIKSYGYDVTEHENFDQHFYSWD